MLSALATEIGADLIALAEVSSTQVGRLQAAMGSDAFEFIDGTSATGRTRFDLCVIYRHAKLRLASKRELVINTGRRSLKLGQRFDFHVAGCAKPMHIIFSHWPSRLYTGEDHVDRHLLGMRLRETVDELLRKDPAASIILAGDYNDEPFDRSYPNM